MSPPTKTIFIFAGEPSGDLHGSHLLKALKPFTPDYKFEAVAGPLMRAQGVDLLMPMEEFAVMGFSDVLFSLPGLIKKFYIVLNTILKKRPEAVILIDYPGFNLRLAKHLRKKGYTGKIIQYICPTVWAHGKNRIQTLSSTLDLLLTIYPFEKQYFSNTGLRVEYIGHPLCDAIDTYDYSDFDTKTDLIALFPGSRKAEIQRNLKKILASAIDLKKEMPKTTFAISVANEKVRPFIEKAILSASFSKEDFMFVAPDKTYELMHACQTAVAKSGTVTLELALHQRPTVVVYELTNINRFIAKYIMRLKLPFYCIVNILLGKEVFPELIERGFTSKNLTNSLRLLHSDSPQRLNCIEECKKVKPLLKSPQTAANAILKVLAC